MPETWKPNNEKMPAAGLLIQPWRTARARQEERIWQPGNIKQPAAGLLIQLWMTARARLEERIWQRLTTLSAVSARRR